MNNNLNKFSEQNFQEKNNEISFDNPLIFSKEKEICRKSLEEIFPRENVKVRDFLDLDENYQLIDEEKLKIISEETEKITFNTNFNNLKRLRNIINLFVTYDKINPENKQSSMKKAFENMDKKASLEKGGNCSSMAKFLKENLEKKGIKSYLVRFGAFGYINNDYVKDGHSGLIIPALISGEKKFIFVDPGIRIFKPIIFDENSSNKVFCDGKYFSIEKLKDKNSEFDFSLKSIGIDGKENFLDFNSRQEWLNPEETLIPESIRSRDKYKIQKFNEKENVLFFLNIEKEEFILKLEEDLIKISFEKFLKFFLENKDSKEKELFLKIFEKFGEDSEKIIYDILKIIENLDIFKEVLLSPSSKKIMNKK